MIKKRILAWVTSFALLLTGIPLLSPVAEVKAAEPTPIYLDQTYSFDERAADLVARMTAAQKAGQTISQGSPAIPELGVSSYTWWNETLHGPMGFNADMSYPQTISMASTWDPELFYKETLEIGKENREIKPESRLNMTFYSPTINMQRDPRWGRNEESFSEDVFLTSKMAHAFVTGLEGKYLTDAQAAAAAPASGKKAGDPIDDKNHLQAVSTIKHYVANNSERNRLSGGAGSQLEENLPIRSLREYYAAPYGNIIKSTNINSVMTAYSTFNNVPSSSSSYLMETLLRQTYGFDGYVTSDCDSVTTQRRLEYKDPHSGNTYSYTTYEMYAAALAHGEDLECNGGWDSNGAYSYMALMPGILAAGIKTDKGTFTENQLDITVHRLMTARMRLGEFDWDVDPVYGTKTFTSEVVKQGAERRTQGNVTTSALAYVNGVVGHTQARIDLTDELSNNSIILLKNAPPKGTTTANLLPIRSIPAAFTKDNPYKVAILGPTAQSTTTGLYSGFWITPNPNGKTIETGIRDAFQKAFGDKVQVDFYRGFMGTDAEPSSFIEINQAHVSAAAAANLAIVVAGTTSATSSEDNDRASIALPGKQADLFSAVGKAQPNTVVIMETCGPMQVTTFEDDVAAILWGSFQGMRKVGFGNVITGAVNPSGKTTSLWHRNVQDEGLSDLGKVTDYRLYRESANGSALPGRTYMYYEGAYNTTDKSKPGVSYPFGYGLSYTTFLYSTPTLSKTANVTADDTIKVSFTVTNSGTVKGKEVAEVYAARQGTIAPDRPTKQLVGFKKVELEAGATTNVAIDVPVADLGLYTEGPNNEYWRGHFEVDPGNWEIQVGGSSLITDAAQKTAFNITSGVITSKPAIVSFLPNQEGDESGSGSSLDVRVGERLIFDKGMKINPNIAIAMNDESLVGRIIRDNEPGHMGSTTTNNAPKLFDVALPTSFEVEYTANRSGVVTIADSWDATSITATGNGVVTITATAYDSQARNTKYAEGSFVVYVKTNPGLDGINYGTNPAAAPATPIPGFVKETTGYTVVLPDSTNPNDITFAAIVPSGITVTNITKPSAFPGIGTIEIADAGDLTQTATYQIGFTKQLKAQNFKGLSAVPTDWNLVGGDMNGKFTADGWQVTTARANTSDWGGSNPPRNVLMQYAGDDGSGYAAVTHLKFNQLPAAGSNHQGGLVLYGSPKNFIRFVYERPLNGTANQFRVYETANGVITQLYASGNQAADLDDIYLQISKIGVNYSFSYSTNGRDWNTLGAARPGYVLPQIGLWITNGDVGDSYYYGPAVATFEDFKLYSAADAQPKVTTVKFTGTFNGTAGTRTYTIANGFDQTISPALFGAVDSVTGKPDWSKVVITAVTVTAGALSYTNTVTPAVSSTSPFKPPGALTITSSSNTGQSVYRLYFEEEFTDTSFLTGKIDDKWDILNEDTSAYDVVEGLGLKLKTLPGDVYGTNKSWKNVFARPAAGNWDVIAKVSYPKAPTETEQQLALLAWQDDDSYAKIYLRGPDLTVHNYAENSGQTNPGPQTPSGYTAADEPLVIYYRIKREENLYSLYWSRDGINFNPLSTRNGSFWNMHVALLATSNSGTAAVIDAYCEWIKAMWLNGVNTSIYTPQMVIDEAYQEVVVYATDKIKQLVAGGIDKDIKLVVPFDYTLTFEGKYFNEDGTLKNPPRDADDTDQLKVTISHPSATAGSSVLLNQSVTVKANSAYYDNAAAWTNFDKALADAKTKFAAGNAGNTYTAESWTALEKAIENGEAFKLANSGSEDAALVRAETAKLEAALSGLVIYVPPLSTDEIMAGELAALTWGAIKIDNASQTLVTSNLRLYNSGTNPAATIEWRSSDESAINPATGAVTRPAAGQPDKTVVLTAVIKVADKSEVKTFTLTVKAQTTTPPGGGTGSGAAGGPSSGTGSNPSAPATSASSQTEQTTTSQPGQSATPSPEAPRTQVSEFKDAAAVADWALAYMNRLISMGVLNGYADGTLAPKGNVTRAEFTKLIVSALSLSPGTGASGVFSDVPNGSWFKQYVDIASSHGMINGIGDGIFAPNGQISRQDLCVIVYRAMQSLGVTLPSEQGAAFTDDAQIADYAKQAVYALRQLGVISGRDTGAFDPAALATREETSKIICLVLDHVQSQQAVSP